MYQKAIRVCTAGHDFMIGWDQTKRHEDRSRFLHDVFFEDNFEANVTKFFRSTVSGLIQKKSLAYKGSRLHLEYLTLATTRESPSHESHRSHLE